MIDKNAQGSMIVQLTNPCVLVLDELFQIPALGNWNVY